MQINPLIIPCRLIRQRDDATKLLATDRQNAMYMDKMSSVHVGSKIRNTKL